MRNLVVGGLFAALVLLFADVQINAAEKAATQQLPAALTALGVSDSQVVTQEQAEQVRGEWLYVYINGYANSYSFAGQVYVNGYANYIYLLAQPYNFIFVAY